MKQSLQLRLGQQLTMTPQLQQAIRLLQLSTIDLQAEIQEALESNPLLELGDEGEAAGDSEHWNEMGDVADPVSQSTADSMDSMDAPPISNDIDRAVDLQDAQMLDELPVDSNWEDVYESIAPTTQGMTADDHQRMFENQSEGAESLRDHLVWQMQLTPFSDTDIAVAEAIIDSIDEDGYLIGSLEEIRDGLGLDYEVGLDEVEMVLHRIQNFDPVGVGARDLRECLLLQLQMLDKDQPGVAHAIQIVKEHLDMLGDRDASRVLRIMKISLEELQSAVGVIRAMNPRPGGAVALSAPEYIIPDVTVKKVQGKWKVELNADAAPRLKINSQYAGLIRRADNSADNTYLRNHLQEARWFIKSLMSRNETLLRVATAIVEHQRGFLEHGEEAMKALVLHDISEELELHESTVSRVTTKKYMHTPRGVFELKYFFSSHVSTAAGDSCSSTAIRAVIKKLIGAENPGKPLSDSKLAEILEDQGVNVARRTIAKYREAMSIPPSSERKRFV